jgi:tetratricopeptide (TPR) repeat protein
MDYEAAVALLRPYNDYNTAIAYLGLDRNQSALEILSREKPTASVNYLLAILYARLGDEQKAVDCFLRSCRQDPSFVHRGNLDPEISNLIKAYKLNGYDGEEAPPAE